ncbi:MAG: glycosyltransferase [Defluviitaleaceae bacterium]|nr:glycosyltransferase [Defluviitaleaceae bacterium]
MKEEPVKEEAMNVSLLLCTYIKDNPQHLKQSLESINAQTTLPVQLIIVKDGPLTEALEGVINSFTFANEVTIVALPQNKTLGLARAAGVIAAKHMWVALMDSDDMCLPDRLQKQVEMLTNNPDLGIIGGQIMEYDDIPGQALSVRSVPTDHEAICKYARRRNPFNAMTVMFNRKKAIEAGNFRLLSGFEDYDLWARMMAKGAMCANHPDVLVHARIGNGLYARRKGLCYIRSELRMQQILYRLKIISKFDYIRNIITRIPVRLLPHAGLAAVYKRFARK